MYYRNKNLTPSGNFSEPDTLTITPLLQLKIRSLLICLLFSTCLSNTVSAGNDPINAKIILEKMFSEVQGIQTLRYNLYAMERINGKCQVARSDIKLQVSPRKVYLKNSSKKLEVLYVDGQNDNNALVNPGKFPYFTMSLNPHKSIMRKDQHHTIDDLGFAYIAKIILKSLPKDPKIFEKTFIYLGVIEWKGHHCYNIYSEFNDFKYVSYTSKKGETVSSISDKFNCGEYRILEKNPKLKANEELKEGTIISVPNCYANKTILYIDTSTHLPLNINIFDAEGLYESYEFTDVRINTFFLKDEFSRYFSQYYF